MRKCLFLLPDSPAAHVLLPLSAVDEAKIVAMLESLSGNMDTLSGNMDTITRDLAYVKRNVLTVYAEIMNPWAQDAKSITSTQRKKFKDASVAGYQPDHADGELVCMVSGETGPEHLISAAHVWPARAIDGRLKEFGLEPSDAYTYRNSILMAKSIEEAFDDLRLGFWYNPLEDALVCHVFDPDLLKEKNLIKNLKSTKYGDLEGRVLLCTPGKIPYRRLVAWHYAACLDNAHKRKWPTATSLEQIPPHVEAWLQAGSPEATWPKGDQHVTYGAASGLLVYGTAGVDAAKRASEVESEEQDDSP